MKIKQYAFSIGGTKYIVAAANEKSARAKAARLFKASVKVSEKK